MRKVWESGFKRIGSAWRGLQEMGGRKTRLQIAVLRAGSLNRGHNGWANDHQDKN
jgi:hypothetical protein